MEKEEIAIIIAVVLALAILGSVLAWSLTHSAEPYSKSCILAGYDTAEWLVFAPEPVCVKRVPVSQMKEQDG